MSEMPKDNMKHLDEMTLLLYVERQLDRARAMEVSGHTQECEACRTLMRALERESRLLTRAMLEEDEPLPSRLAQLMPRAKQHHAHKGAAHTERIGNFVVTHIRVIAQNQRHACARAKFIERFANFLAGSLFD